MMPVIWAVLQAAGWPDLFVLIRAEMLAGPALAGGVGVAGWLIARTVSAPFAANDNAPRLAPMAKHR